MNDQVLDAFEDCLKHLENGASIDEILINYPLLANELRPALEAAVAARSLVVAEAPSDAINRSRTKILGQAARLRTEHHSKISFLRFPATVFTALLIALVLLLGSRELVVVSAKALPGDSLYPIKRALQDARVRLAPSIEFQNEIESQYREQRIDDVLALMDRGLVRWVSFEGIVEVMLPEKWIVDGIPVIFTQESIVLGEIHLGSLIEVEGTTSRDGWVDAQELHLRELKFIGQVETIDRNSWNISDKEFKLTSITQIDSSVQSGDTVMVLARSRDDGTYLALAILHMPVDILNTETQISDPNLIFSGKKAGDIVEFSGTIASITDTTWIIDGYTIIVNVFTKVDGEITLGDSVKVQVIMGYDGSLSALEIESAYGVEDDRDNDINDMDDDITDVDGGTDSDLDDGSDSDLNDDNESELDDDSTDNSVDDNSNSDDSSSDDDADSTGGEDSGSDGDEGGDASEEVKGSVEPEESND